MSVDNTDNICKCGRKIIPPHCVTCGGTKIYKFARKTVSRVVRSEDPSSRDVNLKTFKVMRCDRCGVFDEYQLLYECQAPMSLTARERQELLKDEMWDKFVKRIGEFSATRFDEKQFLNLFGYSIRQARMGFIVCLGVKGYSDIKKDENWAKLTRRSLKQLDTLVDDVKRKELQEKEEKKKELINNPPVKQNFGIRRFGVSKFANPNNPSESMEDIRLKQERQEREKQNVGTSTIVKAPVEVIDDIQQDFNKKEPEEHEQTAEELVEKQENALKKLDVVFEGGLTDDDLRNIPGVMRTD